jgi:hypothetical protein
MCFKVNSVRGSTLPALQSLCLFTEMGAICWLDGTCHGFGTVLISIFAVSFVGFVSLFALLDPLQPLDEQERPPRSRKSRFGARSGYGRDTDEGARRDDRAGSRSGNSRTKSPNDSLSTRSALNASRHTRSIDQARSVQPALDQLCAEEDLSASFHLPYLGVATGSGCGSWRQSKCLSPIVGSL